MTVAPYHPNRNREYTNPYYDGFGIQIIESGIVHDLGALCVYVNGDPIKDFNRETDPYQADRKAAIFITELSKNGDFAKSVMPELFI